MNMKKIEELEKEYEECNPISLDPSSEYFEWYIKDCDVHEDFYTLLLESSRIKTLPGKFMDYIGKKTNRKKTFNDIMAEVLEYQIKLINNHRLLLSRILALMTDENVEKVAKLYEFANNNYVNYMSYLRDVRDLLSFKMMDEFIIDREMEDNFNLGNEFVKQKIYELKRSNDFSSSPKVYIK